MSYVSSGDDFEISTLVGLLTCLLTMSTNWSTNHGY